MIQALVRLRLWAYTVLAIHSIGRLPKNFERRTRHAILLAMAFWQLQVLLATLIVAAFSSAVGNDLANYVCRGTAPTTLTTPIKMSLHTADPGATGASEVSGGSYARQAGASPMYSTASGGACALAVTVSFTSMPVATVTHIGLWDSTGTPKFLQGAALAASKTTGSGDTLQITSATDTFTGS